MSEFEAVHSSSKYKRRPLHISSTNHGRSVTKKRFNTNSHQLNVLDKRNNSLTKDVKCGFLSLALSTLQTFLYKNTHTSVPDYNKTCTDSLNKGKGNMVESITVGNYSPLNISDTENSLFIDASQEENPTFINRPQDINIMSSSKSSAKKRKRHTVEYTRNQWNNDSYFPLMHKYEDIKNIFIYAQKTFRKSYSPMVYVLHFNKNHDVNFIKELQYEINECGSFDPIVIHLDDYGFTKNHGQTGSIKRQKIPLFITNFSGIINDTCIANLKVAGFTEKIHVIILININESNNFCQFRSKIPFDVHILCNGFKIDPPETMFVMEKYNYNEIIVKHEQPTEKGERILTIDDKLYEMKSTIDRIEHTQKEQFTEVMDYMKQNKISLKDSKSMDMEKKSDVTIHNDKATSCSMIFGSGLSEFSDIKI
jgi:hypothetical protein